jgi:hypothetical protein
LLISVGILMMAVSLQRQIVGFGTKQLWPNRQIIQEFSRMDWEKKPRISIMAAAV